MTWRANTYCLDGVWSLRICEIMIGRISSHDRDNGSYYCYNHHFHHHSHSSLHLEAVKGQVHRIRIKLNDRNVLRSAHLHSRVRNLCKIQKIECDD